MKAFMRVNLNLVKKMGLEQKKALKGFDMKDNFKMIKCMDKENILFPIDTLMKDPFLMMILRVLDNVFG